MKRKLTREESQHLIDLGIPKEKASAFEYIGELEWDICDNYLDNPINEKAPIFTTDDLLEILPEEIEVEDKELKDWCNLDIQIYRESVDVSYNTWSDCGYGSCWLGTPYFSRKELIDALYRLVCWCVENKYIKLR